MGEHPEVPKGFYCYTIESVEYGPKTEATAALASVFGYEDRGEVRLKTTVCPYWKRDSSLPEHESGICTLLGINDKDHHTLLWDQVKECDINLDPEPE